MRPIQQLALVAVLALSLSACRTVNDQSSAVKADIHEIDASVRVIYKDADGFVYLVTCPKENGQVNDHAFDESALNRSACSATNADAASDGHLLVKKLKFDTDYLPKLKVAVGLSADGPASAVEVAAIQNQIAVQQDHLNKLAQLAITAQGVDKAKIDAQFALINKKLVDLNASLGQAATTQGQLVVLQALIALLDINSGATFNIAEQNAGLLLRPFVGIADIGAPQPTNTVSPNTGAVQATSAVPAVKWRIIFLANASGDSCAKTIFFNNLGLKAAGNFSLISLVSTTSSSAITGSFEGVKFLMGATSVYGTGTELNLAVLPAPNNSGFSFAAFVTGSGDASSVQYLELNFPNPIALTGLEFANHPISSICNVGAFRVDAAVDGQTFKPVPGAAASNLSAAADGGKVQKFAW